VDFIDDDTLIVTSRASDVALFKLPVQWRSRAPKQIVAARVRARFGA